MKKNTLEKIREALVDQTHEVRVPEPIRSAAAQAFDRMFALNPIPARPLVPRSTSSSPLPILAS